MPRSLLRFGTNLRVRIPTFSEPGVGPAPKVGIVDTSLCFLSTYDDLFPDSRDNFSVLGDCLNQTEAGLYQTRNSSRLPGMRTYLRNIQNSLLAILLTVI
jgi:hypothetical protein